MTGPTLFLNGTNVLWCNTEEYQNYQMKYHSFHIMVSQEIMEIDSCLFRPKLYLCNLMLTKDIYRTLEKTSYREMCTGCLRGLLYCGVILPCSHKDFTFWTATQTYRS